MPAPTASSSNTTNIPSGQLLSQKPIVLWFHDQGAYLNHDAVINPDSFPNVREGQLLRIHLPRLVQQQQQQSQSLQQQQQQPAQDREPLVVKVAYADRETLTRQQHLQISLSKDIAERFNLRFRIEVYVELIDASSVALDHVELSFKEQYLGRSDMWRLQQSLKGTCVYAEKKIIFAGVIKATIRRLFSKDKEVLSGYINETTRMIFRSSSAKFFLFIQMSREMWEFDEDGELYFEKVVNNFLPQLFHRWKEEGTNHVVSIVLFTRVYYDQNDKLDDLVEKTEDGRYYKDFYKVIADWDTMDDWTAVIGPLKEEQLKFQKNILMRQDGDRSIVCGRISVAYEGNVLEAVNLALNPFDNHYVDRDLMRTGLSIILITPGTGKFAVNKKLLRLTNERMTDNGIAMDLVCLSPLPLHVTPLFIYKSSPPPEELQEHFTSRQYTKAGASPDINKNGNLPPKMTLESWDPLYHDDDLGSTYQYYSVPHWIDCSFYHHETGRFLKRDRFRTRCKMYELQMMGIMEHDLASISIPYLVSDHQQQAGGSSLQNNLRSQHSSSSLNDRMSSKSAESNHHQHHQLGNGEAYLSRSANFTSVTRPSFLNANEHQNVYPGQMWKSEDYDRYDSLVFKDTTEPRFSRRGTTTTTPQASKISMTPTTKQSNKASHDNTERTTDASDPWQHSRFGTVKSVTTWHHAEGRKITSMLSQSQQPGGKIAFDSHHTRKDDHAANRFAELFRGPPASQVNRDDGRIRSSRRGTINNNDSKTIFSPADTNPPAEDDDSVVVSSSTVDPVPINNRSSSRNDTRKSTNPSPRQTAISGSFSSIHNKHSGNSDLMIRTSLGGGGAGNRSSPSHAAAYAAIRNSAAKNHMINPCYPSDYSHQFTSYLRRWHHALPPVDQTTRTYQSDDGHSVVHWRSLTSPACLPLTTDYFPSNEELKKYYNHYMYTVSASEDANLYQAGDQSLSEHRKTANLLTEMISQRLAQGFQIIVDNITGSSSYQKPVTKVYTGGDFHTSKDNNNVGSAGGGSSGGSNNAIGHQQHKPSSTSSGDIGNNNEMNNWKHMVWWLSMGHQVHQLTFDSSGQNVEVRRYVRTIDFDITKITYKCAIWPKNIATYRPKTVSFNYPSLLYAWNYLDHLVAGYQEDLTDNLRFWRARFIVIPRKNLPANPPLVGVSHDHLDEEEKRLALFDIWLQNLRKAKWLSPQEREQMQKHRKKGEIGIPDFRLKITTMDPSAYVATEVPKQASSTSTGGGGESNLFGGGPHSSGSSLLSSIGSLGPSLGLSRDSKSKDIAAAMRDPKAGLKIQDRRWHFKIFRNCFIGSEFVDWLISQFDDINTREEAVEFGNSLMQRKPPLFVSSTSRHGFLDGHYFYRLSSEFAPSQQQQQQKQPWFAAINTSGSNSKRSPSISGAANKDSSGTGGGSSSGVSSPQVSSTGRSKNNNKPTIEFDMSHSMIIDVDPYKKSDRRETAILHYDTLHNAYNCYHFQLNWLGCTAQLVQELVQNWSRQAERCGLKVVEGSIEQAYDDSENNNPFQCPVPIDLALKPPSVSELNVRYEVPDNFYEVALVRHLGFVLDVEADSKFEKAKAEGVEVKYSYIKEPYKYDQYIHRSGVAFVQIRPDNAGFYWVNNRLYTNHTPALVSRRQRESSSLMHPELLRQNFQEFCSDAKRLEEFWDMARNSLVMGQGQSTWVFENARMPPPMDMDSVPLTPANEESVEEQQQLQNATPAAVQIDQPGDNNCNNNSNNNASSS